MRKEFKLIFENHDFSAFSAVIACRSAELMDSPREAEEKVAQHRSNSKKLRSEIDKLLEEINRCDAHVEEHFKNFLKLKWGGSKE